MVRHMYAAALADLRHREINYDPARAPEDGRPDGHWHVDSGATLIGREPAGDPVPDGPWETARRLVSEYEFTDARILRGVYRVTVSCSAGTCCSRAGSCSFASTSASGSPG